MWIKICGIRDCETARHLAELDVDAIGLNFYAHSSRHVDVNTAVQVTKILPSTIARVGVFVNHPIRDVEAIVNECQLDHVQLHGDEPPSYIAEVKRRLPRVLIVRAWRMGKDKLKSLKVHFNECRNWNCELSGCLVDAHVAGVFGGSGKKVPWNKLAAEYDYKSWPPLILAGGLQPSNVAEAIESAQPWGVDVASGVESSPGVKDIELVKEFILNARAASQL